MTWGLTSAQVLQLNRGSDGAVFGIGRTGGSNNPSFTFSIGDTSGLTVSAGSGGLNMVQAGNVAISAPTSGTALTVAGFTGSPTIQINSGNIATTGTADFYVSRAGSTSNSIAEGPSLQLQDRTATTGSILQHSGGQTELWQYNSGAWAQIWKVLTNTNVSINASLIVNGVLQVTGTETESSYISCPGIGNGAEQIFIATNGAIGIIAPTAAATALSVAAANGAYASLLSGNNTSGGSYGLAIHAGTTSADIALLVQNASAAATYFGIYGDGGVVVGSPTGGDEGLGTVNATGLYVSGNPVYAGIPINQQTGTTYTTVAADASKGVYGSNTSAKTFTLAANIYYVGAAITFVNGGSGTMTIAPASGVTLVLVNSASTGNRTLATNSIATAYQIASNTWLIAGTGLT